jgi:predicted histidine transporter YuiF (NhaC family)
MYRTFCSLFLLLILLKVYERISTCLPQINKWNAEVTVIGLLILFLFSYRKQNNYITKRVNQFRKSEGDKDA